MPLILVGINHESAPVEVREKLAIGEHALPRSLAALAALAPVVEGAILSTCNRTEIYAVLDPESGATEELLAEFMAGQHGLSRRQFDGRLYFYRDGAAASHLFSVAAGVDSMILGEPDIQRQVKQAMEAAQGARTLGTLLNRLFQDALVAGKRARTETEIARGAVSIGAAAVERAAQIFGDSLKGNTVLVLGAGKMSEVTARHLQARGAPTVLVASRTYERAEHLAAQFGGHARRFEELESALFSADIVVCSTAAPHPVVTRALIKNAMRARHNRPLFLIDIAVPRDVEASVGDLDNVYLYNIDDLMQIVAGSRQTRTAEVTHARQIIDAMSEDYARWRQSLEVAPLVVAVREKLESVRLAELARLRTRLPGLSDKEWRSVEAAMESMTNKIAHPAIVTIKASASEPDASATLGAVRQAFGLEQESRHPGESTAPAAAHPGTRDVAPDAAHLGTSGVAPDASHLGTSGAAPDASSDARRETDA